MHGDWNFIYETWIKGFHASPAVSGILDVRYFTGQRARINRLVLRPGFKVLMAVAPEDEAVIFGYLAHEIRSNECVIHWAYTKSNFRRNGIAKAILAQANPKNLPCSHTHKPAMPLRATSNYNPFLLEDEQEERHKERTISNGVPIQN